MKESDKVISGVTYVTIYSERNTIVQNAIFIFTENLKEMNMKERCTKNMNKQLLFTAMSQVAALVVKGADGSYTSSEFKGTKSESELRAWYSNYFNPHNPKKQVILVEWRFYDAK